MRTVPLTGTKARFARLTMMDGLAERGLTPDAALTAPFTMAVQNGRAVILLDQARVAIDRLYPEAREQARSSFIALRTRWKARMSGIDLTRTPRLTEDLLTKRIESTDFGYDL